MQQIQYRHSGYRLSSTISMIGGVAIGSGFLLEDGIFFLLCEDGSYLLQEDGTIAESGLLDFSTIAAPMLIDDTNVLTLATNDLTFTQMPENIIVYAGYDAGAGYYSGDFTVTFTLQLDSWVANAIPCFCVFSNTLNDARACDVADDGIAVMAAQVGLETYKLSLADFENNASTLMDGTLNLDTVYYCTLVRDDSAQTLTLSIYSDSTRETLVDSIERAAINQSDYEYFYVISCYNDGGNETSSGVISDMTITPDIP